MLATTATTTTATTTTATAIPQATLLAWAYRVACQPAVYTQPDLLASAEERIARLEAGIATEADVQGLQNWAEEYGWIEGRTPAMTKTRQTTDTEHRLALAWAEYHEDYEAVWVVADAQ